MSRDIILHAHIFKNAGTSFDYALKQNFGEGFIDNRDDNDIIKYKQKYLEKYLDKHTFIKAFSNHSIHFIPKSNDRYRFHTVYLIRHPIDRIQSVYTFEKKQPSEISEGAEKAKEYSFEEYLDWYINEETPATIRNSQTIFISGQGPEAHDIDSKCKVANNRLSNIELLGVVDRYDESMVVFEEYLKRYFPDIDLSYIIQNVSDNSSTDIDTKINTLLSSLSTDLAKKIIEKNSCDLLLYAKANILLNQKIKTINDFENKLKNFKERCLLKLVLSMSGEGKFQDIIDMLKPLQNSLTNVKIYIELANAYREVGLYKDALYMLKKGQTIFNDNPWIFFEELLVHRDTKKILLLQERFKKYSNRFANHLSIIDIYRKKLNIK